MCGICGRIDAEKSSIEALRGQLEQMMRLMEHRGPDHGGLWAEPGAGIGYRRLSVIDLASGNQPVFSEDGRKVLVFNGEIYNFRELKKQFETELRFRTNSDTEVLMRLYEKFGVDCLQHLRGMFAFAIWNQDQQSLFFARDRIGKKPLFYSIQDGNLIFASELRSLLIHDDFRFEISNEAIYHFLTLQYIPSPLSIFQNVWKLPPAHYGIFKAGKLNIHRYWTLNRTVQEWDEQTALQRFNELLYDAVSLRLISDVPLGAFLSGGIDSTTVVGAMTFLAPDRVKTFNISFEEAEFNEAPFARAVSEQFGTQHQELKVTADHTTILPKLVWHYSEPYADPSAIPTYYLSCMTREFVTVALSGDGGDELFGGYDRYLFSEPSSYQHRAESPLMKMIRKIPYHMRGVWRIRRWLDERFLGLPEIYLDKICFFNESEKKQLLGPAFLEATRGFSTLDWVRQKMEPFRKLQFPGNLMAFDAETYLPDDLLVKSDIASMACSLEVRCPLLDHHMIEFAATLPTSIKIRKNRTKYLLRKHLEGKIGQELTERPKMGFGVPLHSWLRNELRSMTEDLLLSDTAAQRGYFRKHAVEKLINRHWSGLFDHTYQIYALLVLEIWHRLFLDKSLTQSP